MLCKKPYMNGLMAYGCGQCIACRINKSRMWVGRMLLEYYEHPVASFITLTYGEKCPNELVKKDLQDFFKRLRSIWPEKIRYYAVGEYGEENGRPHYHAILFGVPPEAKPYVDKAWSIDGCSIGFTYVGTCSPGSCAYVAQYLMKTGTSDQRRKENGRQKEFAIMSRKPGIGSRAIDRFVGAYKTEVGSVALKVFKWPSERFRAGGRNYPIGRYLKGQLLTKLGFEKDDIESHNVGIRTINDMKVAVEGAKSYFNARAAAVEQQEGRIMVWKTKRRKV